MSKCACSASHCSFVSSSAQALLRHFVRLDVVDADLQVVEPGVVQRLDSLRREQVAVGDQSGDHAVRPDAADQGVEIRMEHRLAAAERDDRRAEVGQLVDPREHRVGRHRLGHLVVLVAVAAVDVAAADRARGGRAADDRYRRDRARTRGRTSAFGSPSGKYASNSEVYQEQRSDSASRFISRRTRPGQGPAGLVSPRATSARLSAVGWRRDTPRPNHVTSHWDGALIPVRMRLTVRPMRRECSKMAPTRSPPGSLMARDRVEPRRCDAAAVRAIGIAAELAGGDVTLEVRRDAASSSARTCTAPGSAAASRRP